MLKQTKPMIKMIMTQEEIWKTIRVTILGQIWWTNVYVHVDRDPFLLADQRMVECVASQKEDTAQVSTEHLLKLIMC